MQPKTDFELAQIIWDYMRYEQPLQKADIIFALGSDDTRIADHAAWLYLQSYAPCMLFSGNRGATDGIYGEMYFDDTEAEILKRRAIELGVPAAVIYKEERSTNTGENILFGYETLAQLDIKPTTMILVQKPFMLRRTYATFVKQWPGKQVPKIITSALDVTFKEYVNDPRYDFAHTVNTMVGDLQRIKKYPARGFQIEQPIPAEVWEAYEQLVQRGYTKHLL